MADQYLGHAIENGRLRFLSVSAVEKADPQSNGCYRRYAYRYRFGFKEVESDKNKAAKEFGINGHARIASYLKTGNYALEPVEMKGLHFIPKPGPDLWVEQPFHTLTGGEITSSLTAGGVPFVGYIDCGHRRPVTTTDAIEMNDPDGRVELIDWKFKGVDRDRYGNPTYKQASELVHTIQMAGYGMVVANTQPDATHVRLSHGYFFKKGNARKVTKLHVLDDCRRTWEYTEGVARSLVHIAAETDIERVPGNVRACDAFGGCPFRESSPDGSRQACSAYRKNSLDVLYGKVAEDFQENPTMPLLSQVMPNAPTPAPQTTPPGVPDMRAQLAAEEAQLRAQVTQPSIPEAYVRITNFGRGAPAMGGELAQAYAAAGGQSIAPGTTYQGSGQLGGLVLQTPAHLYQLLGELEGKPAAPPAPVPMPAPIASAAPMAAAMPAPAMPSALPPDAPPSMPQLAQAHAPAAPAVSAPMAPGPQEVVNAPAAGAPSPEPDAAKRGRGRPKKDASTAPAATPEAATSAPLATQQPVSPTPPAGAVPQGGASAGAVTSPIKPVRDAAVFVDCIPNYPYTDLHAYISGINAKLAERYCVTEDGKPATQDIRCAPKHVAVLAFGAWKGALAEVVRSNPPAPGVYYIDTRTSELAEVVAEAMRDVCEKHGVLYVRGVR